MATKNLKAVPSTGIKVNKAAPAPVATQKATTAPVKVQKATPKAATAKPVEKQVQTAQAIDITNGTVGAKKLAEDVREALKGTGIAVSTNVAQGFISAFENVVAQHLSDGNEVALPGFGKFRVALRKGGARRNPRSGETIEVSASWAPSFKPGSSLKQAVNTRAAE